MDSVFICYSKEKKIENKNNNINDWWQYWREPQKQEKS